MKDLVPLGRCQRRWVTADGGG